MVKILMGVAIGILISIAFYFIWTAFSKPASPAPNAQQSSVVQSSPVPSPSPIPSPSVVQDYLSFINYIKTLGLAVGSETKAYSDLYSGNITEVVVNGETMYVIEYTSEDEMNQRAGEISTDASTISRNGESITIEKSSTPTHYYKKGKIILIYAGRNESMVQILKEIFGDQFAGHD